LTPSFDLLDQPWLPCIDAEGRTVEVGIREALLRAHELADLRDPSPLTTAALLRLLLAVLHAALQGPRTTPERIAIWQEGRLPTAQIDSYLAHWAGRFDVFDPIYPFYQDPKLTNEPADTIARLAVELASGNNATLFDHSHDDSAGSIGPAECARWLVTTQAFAVGFGNSAQSKAYTHPRFHDAPAA
jgi:CRISPR system Cascade subunit CasA